MYLFRKKITRYVDLNGTRCSKDAPDAKRIDEMSSKWYGRFRTSEGTLREVALHRDKTASPQELAKLVRKAEQADSGLLDPFEEQRTKPLADHVTAFRQSLESKGNSPQHVALTVARCDSVFAGCGFKWLCHLDADKVSNWLKERRDGAKGKKPRTVKGVKPFGITSSNHHLVAVKGFGNWLVKARRLERNPFAHLSVMNAKVDVRVERRALESEELSRLIAATELSQTVFRDLTGPDRAALYTLAAMTGLRANELASLTALSFNFIASPPTVKVTAANEKAGRGATLPLHPFVVTKLTHWLASRPSASKSRPSSKKLTASKSGAKGKPTAIAETLWPGSWSSVAAKMIRRDLEEARSLWLAEVEPTHPEFARRSASLFLKPANANGEVADFHALRQTFITMLASSVVHPKVAQQLARHSTITLTMDRYSHMKLADLTSAVSTLPSIIHSPRLMCDTTASTTQTPPQNSVAHPDTASTVVALRVALPGENPSHPLITADESSASKTTPLPVPTKTQNPWENRGLDDFRRPVRITEKRVRPGGLEPPTDGLEIRCSIRLSYGRLLGFHLTNCVPLNSVVG